MEYKKYGNEYLLRVDKGEKIAQSLRTLCEQEGIECGGVYGLGAADHVELGLFDTAEKQFIGHTYEGAYEIASLNGNISRMEGKVYLHLHAVIADAENLTRGGHLVEARVSATAELVVQAFSGKAGRKYSQEIGLNLFEF